MTAPAFRDRARHRVALLHLAISTTLVAGIMAVAFGLWYPGPLRALSGIDGHLLLLFAVVLVVGPALTWLVYRTGKRTLRLDLTVVVLIQLLFLGYACAMLARLRPVYLVGMDNHIELVRAVDIDRDDLAAVPVERRALPWTGPLLVGVLPPAGTIFGVDEYARRPAYQIDYAKIAPLLVARGREVTDLDGLSPDDFDAVTRAIAGSGRTPDAVRVVPLVSTAGRAVMLLDGSSGQPLGPIAVTL